MKKWYQKTWFLWIMLIFLPPVGIVLLWTLHKSMPRMKKLIFSIIFFIWFMFVWIIGGSTNTNPTNQIPANTLESVDAATTIPENSPEEAPAATPEQTETPAPESTVILTDTMRVHFLDVGQGVSVLIESDGRYALYDGGGPERSSYVVSYLKEQQIEKLDYIIASHYDIDHISGLVGVINVFPVDRIIGPNYTGDTDIYQSFMDMISSKGETLNYTNVGKIYELGSAEMEVLSPENIYADANECSIVLKVTCAGKSVLLTGDASEQSESDMLSAEKNLDSDILLIGHHGSSASSSDAFLEKVTPEYAIISCGSDNKYRHPAQDTMNRIQSKDMNLYRTDLQGTILASLGADGITWSAQPTTDFSGGDVDLTPTQAPETQGAKHNSASSEFTYILNTNTLKFHLPSCHSADKIAPENRSDFNGTRDDVIAMGYDTCGNCNP